jgi:hypothetical protein
VSQFRQSFVQLAAAVAMSLALVGNTSVYAQGQKPDANPAGSTHETGQPSPDHEVGPQLGVLSPANGANNGVGKAGLGGSNLSYHNGPVVANGNTVYAIYWNPTGYATPMADSYMGLINQFFNDVAVQSTKTDGTQMQNVYYSDTQYYSTVNGARTNIQYKVAFGGSVVDTSDFPASGCSDTIAQTTVCLSDAQLRAEISKVIHAQGWQAAPNNLFFVFTPRNVGSCYGSSCAYSNFCAYHSWYFEGSTPIYYANQPYADTVPSACDAGQHPNKVGAVDGITSIADNDADATISIVSHEHNEMITDPQGSAWYDLRGYENADKCAWNFGAVSGPTGAQSNQTINGLRYFLQQEWSNRSSRCVLTGI